MDFNIEADLPPGLACLKVSFTFIFKGTLFANI